MIEPGHLVAIGGALGAVARYQLGQWVSNDRIPLATLTVNVAGSFLLGLVTGAGSGDRLVAFVGVGFCGAFTTYSSFSFETVRLWETGDRLRAAAYAAGTLVVCVGGLALGWHLGGELVELLGWSD